MVEVIKSFIRSLNLFIVLWLLSVKPTHGYGIIKEFRKLTGLEINPGTIYPLLHMLEKEEFVISKWVIEKNKTRRYYFLTLKGKDLFKKFQSLFKKHLKVFIEFLIVEPQ